MSDTARPGTDRRAHRLTALVYLLDLLGVMTGITALIGVSLNYLKRASVAGTVYASHFDWQIRTFWWALALTLAGGVLIGAAEAIPLPLLGIPGALVILLTLFWFVYRLLRGYMWLSASEPVGGRGDDS